jgi:MFS family permease
MRLGEMRRARGAVLASFFLLGMIGAVLVARIPAIKHRLAMSDGELGIALLAAPVGLVIVMLVSGRLVDRFGSGRIARPTGVAYAGALVPLGLAGDLPSFMAALFVFGLLSGLLDVAMNAHAVRVERGYGRPLMTSFHAVYSLGGLAGALFGGLFAWLDVAPAPTFAVAAAPMAIGGWIAGRWLLPSPDPASPRDPSDPPPRDLAIRVDTNRKITAERGRLFRRRRGAQERRREGLARRPALVIMLLGLVAFCCLVGEGAADNWSAVYLHEDLGTSQGFAALGFAAFSVAMTIGRLFGDRLAVRFGPVRLVRGCGLLAAAGLAAGLLANHPIGGLAGFAALGAGLSCIVPQVFSAAGNADPARAGRNIARVAGLGYSGIFVGPVVIGGAASLIGLPAALGIPVVLALGVAAAARVMAPAERNAPTQLEPSPSGRSSSARSHPDKP